MSHLVVRPTFCPVDRKAASGADLFFGRSFAAFRHVGRVVGPDGPSLF
jgi:hypothetical protein